MLQVIIEILALIIFEFARAVLEPKFGSLVERATSDTRHAIDDVLCWLSEGISACVASAECACCDGCDDDVLNAVQK